MTEITHLVTNGCSFTYCQGLDNPKEQGWPTLVAKQLGVPVVNLALQGCGNDSIHRRTYEYVYENLPTGSKPLVIIAWSQYWRQEQWFNVFPRRNTPHELNDYRLIAMPHSSPDGPEEKNLLEHWNDENFYRRSMLYKLSLANLFKSLNIPYIMSDYANDYRFQGLEESRAKLPNMVNSVGTIEGNCMSFVDVTHNLPKTLCGHDGLEAQSVLAEFIMTQIQRMYSDIKIKPTDTYRTTKDVFSIVHKSIVDVNPAWI